MPEDSEALRFASRAELDEIIARLDMLETLLIEIRNELTLEHVRLHAKDKEAA